ncbi:MAG: tripartite tricarboxylate transporter substrate binding protein [Burkholderiales bacterium]
MKRIANKNKYLTMGYPAASRAWIIAAIAMQVPMAIAADAARGYPSRPVRIVVGFPAGGNTDIISRAMGQKLTERFGQTVIVENRPGAGSMIGTDYVAKATADGHTLLLVSGAFSTQAAVLKKLPFDPSRDFAWITNAVVYPFAVIVKPDARTQSIADLIGAAKKSPGKLNYGSVGIGSVLHLAVELFNTHANVDMTHIPFKGGSELVIELVSGRIDVVFETLTGAYPHVQAGKLNAIAVTSRERSPQLPNVPTVAQTLPGYEVTSYSGFAAPRGTPPAIIAKLNREMRVVLDQPDIRKRFTDLGGAVTPTAPGEFGAHVTGEIAKWKKIATAKKIEIQ